MVAETHSRFDDLSVSQIIEFIVDIAGDDVDPSVAESSTTDGTFTLEQCGFGDPLDIEDLVGLLGEEFGERTLVGEVLDEVDSSFTVTDLVRTMYPGLD